MKAENDDVTLAIGVGRRGRGVHSVVMRFDDEGTPLVLSAEQAEIIAAKLMTCAFEARERNGARKAAS